MSPLPHDEFERELLEAMESARLRYESGTGPIEEYARALKRFGDFVVHGLLPDDLKTVAKPAGSEQAIRDAAEKKSRC